MSNAITGRLGLDTKPLTSDLNRAVAEVSAGGRKMSDGFSNAAGSSEKLLLSSHRVARQTQNVVRDLLSGADAATVFSAGLEGLERSMHLPLGSLIGLGIGAIAIEKLHEVVAEYEKLNKELDKAAVPRPFGSRNELEQQMAEANALRKKAEEETDPEKHPWKTGVANAWSRIKHAFSPGDVHSAEAGKLGKTVQEEAEERFGKLDAMNVARSHMAADYQKRLNAIEASKSGDVVKEYAKLQIEFEEKVQEAMHKGGGAAAKAMIEAWSIANENFAEKVADKNRYSLAELAANGPESVGWRKGEKGGVAFQGQNLSIRDAAKLAEEEKAEADRLRLTGANPDVWHGENWHRSRYDQLTNGMGNMLKDDEKMQQFRGALDASEVLKAIAKNTEQTFQHK